MTCLSGAVCLQDTDGQFKVKKYYWAGSCLEYVGSPLIMSGTCTLGDRDFWCMWRTTGLECVYHLITLCCAATSRWSTLSSSSGNFVSGISSPDALHSTFSHPWNHSRRYFTTCWWVKVCIMFWQQTS
jgi:hypothetical protein